MTLSNINWLNNQLNNLMNNKYTKISRTKAVELINNSKGRRFTVTFTKLRDGSTRTINGSRKNQTSLGNITMVVPKVGYRSFNPNTLTELRINGSIYTIK